MDVTENIEISECGSGEKVSWYRENYRDFSIYASPLNESAVPNVGYEDWYINQKRVPDPKSEEYEEFYDFHHSLCISGLYLPGKIYVPPFLYWHINFWHTDIDVLDEYGYIKSKYTQPSLRDNEWIIFNTIHQGIKEKKGVVIAGIRRTAKTVMEASYITWGAVFDENSHNVIAGLNWPDISLITEKIDKGYNYIPKPWRWHRLTTDWKKREVNFGIRKKDGKKEIFSSIFIRNLEEGVNKEAIAGTKPKKLVIDEAGKGNFIEALHAAMPGLTSRYGWICSPIVTFTGGDVTKVADAKKLMMNPEVYNFLVCSPPKETRTYGLFIGHSFRMEAKKESSLGDFLGIDELKNIPMLVSDREYAEKYTNETLERLKNSSDRDAYIKELMYYPKTVDDIFGHTSYSFFDSYLIQRQLARVEVLNHDKVWDYVFFEQDPEGNISYYKSNVPPISSVPPRASENLDAPVVIYEHPISENPPKGLYVAGVDSYRQSAARYSTSLGVVYIFKRIHNLTEDKYQFMIVASYAARPEKKSKWDLQARLLIKYYNAIALVENDEYSFIEYMKYNNEAHLYLQKQPAWVHDVVKETTVSREYGVHRSAKPIREFLHGLLKSYISEEIVIERDQEGNPLKKVTGVFRIFDKCLLEEMLYFSDMKDDICDRIVAFELALAQAFYSDMVIGIQEKIDDVVSSLYSNKDRRRPSPFRKMRYGRYASYDENKENLSIIKNQVYGTQKKSRFFKYGYSRKY